MGYPQPCFWCDLLAFCLVTSCILSCQGAQSEPGTCNCCRWMLAPGIWAICVPQTCSEHDRELVYEQETEEKCLGWLGGHRHLSSCSWRGLMAKVPKWREMPGQLWRHWWLLQIRFFLGLAAPCVSGWGLDIWWCFTGNPIILYWREDLSGGHIPWARHAVGWHLSALQDLCSQLLALGRC